MTLWKDSHLCCSNCYCSYTANSHCLLIPRPHFWPRDCLLLFWKQLHLLLCEDEYRAENCLESTAHWGDAETKNCLMTSVPCVARRLMFAWDDLVEAFSVLIFTHQFAFKFLSWISYSNLVIWSAMLNLYHIVTWISMQCTIYSK